MARLRLNDISSFGATNPVTLTLNGTTATWSSAPAFPTIAAPDYAVIIVEPDTANEEIIQVTAYTAAATTATVVRNFEATSGGANAAPAHTAMPWVHGPSADDFFRDSLRDTFLASTSGDFETIPSWLAGSTGPPLASGTLSLTARPLPADYPVGHITFWAAGAGVGTPAHWWFGLFDKNRVLLALTADQLTGAWGSFSSKTLAIATIASGAASVFKTTYSGLYYVGLLIAATTLPNLSGGPPNINANLASAPPIIQGRSTTGLTTPPAFPFTANALDGSSTYGSQTAYAAVGT